MRNALGGLCRVGDEDKRDGTETVPYGEGWGCILSFPVCSCLNSGDPSVGYADSSPKRGAKRAVPFYQSEIFAAERCPF